MSVKASAWHLWLDVAHQAWMSLGDRPLRTGLSVAGIAIGIAAVTLIGVVTQGGKQVIFSELQTFGLRSAWIARDRKIIDPYRATRPGTGINNDDFAALVESGCCTGLARVSPVVYGGRDAPAQARAGRHYARTRMEGVGLDYLAINNDTLALGRAFSIDDINHGRYVAIIGEQVRADLFGPETDPIGAQVRLGDNKFEVIGVISSKDRSLLASIGSAGGQDANSRLLVPYRRAQSLAKTDEIDVLQAEVAPGSSAAAAVDQATTFLRQRHRDAYAYRGETMEQYVQTANRILGGVSTIGLIAASISLVVAGLGILNIMGTSVIERTREIGVRKALGGTEGEILAQFLFEATLISAMGGVIGLVLGAGVSVVITRFTGFPLIPSLPLVIVAFVVAVAVGLLSGLYPAYRAARLRPVEALRYE